MNTVWITYIILITWILYSKRWKWPRLNTFNSVLNSTTFSSLKCVESNSVNRLRNLPMHLNGEKNISDSEFSEVQYYDINEKE